MNWWRRWLHKKKIIVSPSLALLESDFAHKELARYGAFLKAVIGLLHN